jgi:hypothetical protein
MNKKFMSSSALIRGLSSLACLSLLAFSVPVAAAPPVPTLNTPYNGQINVPQASVNFSWSSLGATNYRIVISQNAVFSGFTDLNGSSACNATCFTIGTTATSRLSAMSMGAQPYYWKVRANNATGASEWSVVRSFTTTGSYRDSIWSETLRAYNNGERKIYKGAILTDGTYTYCARHVRWTHNLPSKYSSAATMCQNYANKGLINASGIPPVGATVCYRASAPGTGGNGHIAIAQGNGQELGVTSVANGVTLRTSLTNQSYYWGWVGAASFRDNY